MARRINLLKIEDAAEILSCSEMTVRALIREGKLPSYQINTKITRIDEADVYAYLESRRNQTAVLRRKTRVVRPSQERVCTYKPGDKVV